MLRAVRFACELDFELAPDLLPAMRQMKRRLAPPVISVERIADELRRMLTSERPRRAIELRPGDANDDGKVDFADLLILAQNYGKSPGQTFSTGDFNNDGSVGFDDLLGDP